VARIEGASLPGDGMLGYIVLPAITRLSTP
jgi:hypothetical protein